MNQIKLQVEGKTLAEFAISEEPHAEKDLLQYKEYEQFYYSVGLGAPVKAIVTTKKGLFSKEQYSFEFKICGNAVSQAWMNQITAKYNAISKLEEMHTVMDEQKIILLYSFADNESAYGMYKELEGICNVGVFHGVDKNSGRFLVKIEYMAVEGIDEEKEVKDSKDEPSLGKSGDLVETNSQETSGIQNEELCQNLKKAFERRVGRKDNESFLDVVSAFFKEYKLNSLLIVPQQKDNSETKPMLYKLGDGIYAFMIITDISFVKYYDNCAYDTMPAKDVMAYLKQNHIKGILINSFSEFNCWLPKESIFTYMDASGIKY